MPKTLPVVKRGPGNPRPVTYPVSLRFRPRQADAEVFERYCAATRQPAGVVLRKILKTWARRRTIQAMITRADTSEAVPCEP